MAAVGKRKRDQDKSKKDNDEGNPTTVKKSVLQTEDGSFPRGGGSNLTALEIKHEHNEAIKDVLFGNDKEVKRKSKKQKKTTNKNISNVSSEPKKMKIESVSYSKLVPGCVVLGQISQISTLELALSLPNNITGYVSITNISPSITSQLSAQVEDNSDEGDEDVETDEENDDKIPELPQLFQVGSWLRAVVVSTETESKKKRVELTIEPSKVNDLLEDEDLGPGMAIQGSVHSIEDHGVIINIGQDKEVSAFISKKELSHSNIDFEHIRVGGVLLLTILSKSSNGRTLTLTASPSAKKLPVIATISSPENLISGILVEALISEVRSTGLVTKIFGHIDGTVDFIHCGLLDGTSLSDKFKPGQKVIARVISTIFSSSEDSTKVALSLLDHVVGFLHHIEEGQESIIGQIIEEVTVQAVDSLHGLFVNLGRSALGYVHISRISSEERIEELEADEGKYKVGSTHKARIVGYSSADKLYILSMEKKIIDQKYLRLQDIPVGETVKVTVDRILPKGGLIASISEGITGIVNEMHISDIKLIHPEKQFKPGKQVMARILTVDKEQHKIKLTLKKTLVNTQDPILSSFKDAIVGMKTPGVIISLKPRGAIVEFFGGIRGYLPVAEISEAFIKDPKDHFRIGQSVSVRIISVNSENNNLIVSCRTSSAGETEKQQQQFNELVVGSSIVAASVVEKTSTGVIVEIQPHSVRGVLSTGHLSDDGGSEKNKSMLKKLKVGQVLKNLVVLEKNASKRFVTVTAKNSLVEDAKANSLPTCLEDCKPNAVLHGFVKNLTIKGLFICFANNFTGLALKQDLSDSEFIKDPQDHFELVQSVTCRVINVDQAQQRVQLTLRAVKDIGETTTLKTKSSGGTAALNPVDESTSSLSEFVPGKITKAKVVSVKGTQVNVALADNQQGRIDVSQVYDKFDDIEDPLKPLKPFKKNQIISVKVIGYHDARNHRFLPISHRNSKHVILELSGKASDLETEDKYKRLSLENGDITVGSQWVGYINNITMDFVWVNLTPSVRGRIPLVELTGEATTIGSEEELNKHYPVGSAIECMVTEVSNDSLKLSHRKVEGSSLDGIDNVRIGDVIPAQVVKITQSAVVLKLNENSLFASCYLTDTWDEYQQDLNSSFDVHDLVRAKVVNVDKSNNKIHVTLRDSQVGSSIEVKDKFIQTVNDISAGDVVRGFVKNVADSGLFVSLGRSVSGRVQIKNLSDSFLTDWKKYFSVHQLVEARVLSINNGKVELTLKRSAITGQPAGQAVVDGLKAIEDLEVGEAIDGVVKKVEDFGVFIRLEGTNNISGLCHKSQVADIPLSDISKVFSEGDKVKVKVLKIDVDKKRVSLGMKASYFTEEGDDSDIEMEDYNEDDDIVLMNYEEDEDDDSEEEEEDDEDEEKGESEAEPGSGLSAGFDWTASILDQGMDTNGALSDSSGDEEEEEDSGRHKRRRKNKGKPVEDQTGSLSTKLPQSVSDFERLLVGSPNSSVLWMNFMAFQLQLSEIDKAREIGERALKTINYREEQEKLNIWIALLNLENSFGTQQSLDETFKRAVQYNDPKTIHLKLANIYASQSDKHNRADNLYQTIVKKFGSEDADVWVMYAMLLFDKLHNQSKARALFDRALTSLPTSQHKSIVPRFAQLEYTYGDVEKGRTIFEKLIESYPKRFGLWQVYLDLEIKYAKSDQEESNRQYIESLFERLTNNPDISAKQAKFFFKKWLSYETEHGNEKSVDRVKAKAMEFVNRKP